MVEQTKRDRRDTRDQSSRRVQKAISDEKERMSNPMENVKDILSRVNALYELAQKKFTRLVEGGGAGQGEGRPHFRWLVLGPIRSDVRIVFQRKLKVAGGGREIEKRIKIEKKKGWK